jgi:hypothetical protein
MGRVKILKHNILYCQTMLVDSRTIWYNYFVEFESNVPCQCSIILARAAIVHGIHIYGRLGDTPTVTWMLGASSGSLNRARGSVS